MVREHGSKKKLIQRFSVIGYEQTDRHKFLEKFYGIKKECNEQRGRINKFQESGYFFTALIINGNTNKF